MIFGNNDINSIYRIRYLAKEITREMERILRSIIHNEFESFKNEIKFGDNQNDTNYST